MKSRRLSAMLLAGCMAASLLTGCGNAANDDNQVNLDTAAAEDTGSEATVLTFFSSMDSASADARHYRQIIDRYNQEHSDVMVTIEGLATGDGYNEYLTERLDKGEGDDIFIVNADSVKDFYKKGYFYDMSEFSAFQELNDAAKTQSMIGDIAYCIPFSMNSYCMYVNMDVLGQYQLETPESLEDFIRCCETIKAGGGTPISLNRWYAMTVPAMANGLYKIYGADNTNEIIKALNSGEAKIGDYMLEGFEVVERFIDSGWYGDGLTTEAVDAIKAGSQDIPDFAEGRTAFLFSTVSARDMILEKNADAGFITTGVPISGGMVTLPAVGVRMCINANGDELEKAKEFVAYLTENEKEAAENSSDYLPAYKDGDFACPEFLEGMYEIYQNNAQIPIEDMKLSFTYWDTVRVLCIDMFDGSSAQEAAERYNQIQSEQTKAAE